MRNITKVDFLPESSDEYFWNLLTKEDFVAVHIQK